MVRKDRAKKSVMESICSEVKYGRSYAADDVLDAVVDTLREQGEDSFHDGNYKSALYITEELQYIERCTPSLEKYVKKQIAKLGDD